MRKYGELASNIPAGKLRNRSTLASRSEAKVWDRNSLTNCFPSSPFPAFSYASSSAEIPFMNTFLVANYATKLQVVVIAISHFSHFLSNWVSLVLVIFDNFSPFVMSFINQPPKPFFQSFIAFTHIAICASWNDCASIF
jgi:hypothetical protein